jgi:mannose/fructose/N-acetylgalactosamine-specific phosphotransferase system component IIC
MHRVDRLIDEGNKEKQIIGIHYLNLIITIVVYWLITFVALYAGNEIIAKVVDSIPAWVINGLNAVAKVLPAMGFALLLNLLMDKDIVPYLIMGFALSSWMGLSMIAVATIALAVALVMYQIKSKDLELERRSFSDYEEEL